MHGVQTARHKGPFAGRRRGLGRAPACLCLAENGFGRIGTDRVGERGGCLALRQQQERIADLDFAAENGCEERSSLRCLGQAAVTWLPRADGLGKHTVFVLKIVDAQVSATVAAS
jgi:hypothetical protein